jgi:hypothetical protein
VKGENVLGLDDDAKAFAQTIADTLKAAKKPLIISVQVYKIQQLWKRLHKLRKTWVQNLV